MGNGETSLLISFSGLGLDDETFCQGMRFGMIYQRMKHGDEPEIDTRQEFPVRTASVAVYERAAAALGWDIAKHASQADGKTFEDWTDLVLTRKKEPAVANPRGLRVVT